MIEVTGVSKTMRSGTEPLPILRDVSFSIARGEFVAIVGASGSGKSTLLGLMAGLDSVSAGSIQLDGTEITKLEEDAMARIRGQKIGFVFQSYQLIPTLTALENVLLPLELNGVAGGTQRARDLLTSVGLADRLHHYPVQLSGGEQQRVALARAFVLKPPIILSDEPTGNLDTANGKVVLDLLLSLNREQGTTLVVVTHDPALAAIAGRRITLRDGALVSDSSVSVEGTA
jgi:putative ABC transport system ATP-binding protein